MAMDHLKVQSLSQVFSPKTFRKAVVEGDLVPYLTKFKNHSSIIGNFQPSNNREAIKQLYSFFIKNYRFEYIYKNTLINSLIKERKLTETTVLNELSIGKSIADTVFINGEPVLYEIKTELDTPEKLLGQIEDYQKAFAKIWVVTHESIYYRYYLMLKSSSVGIMYLTSNGTIKEMKPAVYFPDKLDHTSLFKLLRKEEYSCIIKEKFGYLPNVPNTLFFKTCLNLLLQLPIHELYQAAHEQLKKRGVKELGFLHSDQTPRELKYICYTLGFTPLEYQYLYDFLTQPYNP